MTLLFSQRYENLIRTADGEPIDKISGDIPYDIKVRLANVMENFNEPKTVRLSRYNTDTEIINALELAIDKLNNKYGYQLIDFRFILWGTGEDEAHRLAEIFTPYFLDLIELQYSILSNDPENGKEGFRKEINSVLNEGDVPWLLVDGRMIKIDASQFEQDLKRKSLELLRELKDAEPAYQGAYNELIKAVEFLERGDFAEAIINAEKSYESVMKVICNEDKGTASALAKKMTEGAYLNLPDMINRQSFQENVLISLPYLRNHAAAHGAGTADAQMTEAFANLAVDLACTLDTYLIRESANKK